VLWACYRKEGGAESKEGSPDKVCSRKGGGRTSRGVIACLRKGGFRGELKTHLDLSPERYSILMGVLL